LIMMSKLLRIWAVTALAVSSPANKPWGFNFSSLVSKTTGSQVGLGLMKQPEAC
jgi:hypothetical protein